MKSTLQPPVDNTPGMTGCDATAVLDTMTL
jgi:hypothetical protein